MKIGIIANRISDINAGIGVYTYNLLVTLFKIEYKKNNNVNGYTIIYYKRCSHLDYMLNNYDFLDEIIIPAPKIPFGKVIQEMIIMPYKLRYNHFDIIHDTFHFGPFLFLKNTKKILTVHDITPILYSKTHKKSRALAHKYLFPLILK